MPDQATRRRVLQALVNSKTGLTERELVVALRPSKRASFQEEVERDAKVSRALQQLKSEHRAWPTDKAGLRRWNITPRGKRQF